MDMRNHFVEWDFYQIQILFLFVLAYYSLDAVDKILPYSKYPTKPMPDPISDRNVFAIYAQ